MSGKPLLLAFGDSLTAGYGLRSHQSFPARLEALLAKGRPNARVLNAGISGDTTAGGRARLSRTLDRLERAPDLVILELGANDAIRAIDPATTRDNLDAMLREMHRRAVPTLLAGMVAPPFLGAYGERFSAVFPALAEAHRVPLYPFFLDGVAGVAGLTLADGMHPNARAIEQVAARILPHVEAVLDATKRAAV